MDTAIDAHAKPPDHLRAVYKRFQKMSPQALDIQPDICDVMNGANAGFLRSDRARKELQLPDEVHEVIGHFLENQNPSTGIYTSSVAESGGVYEHPDLPGLFVFPSLLPQTAQLRLLDALLHRDLSNPNHMTNLHLHYHVQYPSDPLVGGASFFHSCAEPLIFQPKDPTVHKPLRIPAVLNKKLRWTTLGGQYDWTQKVYPSTPPPPFPPDVAALVEGLFPAMKAQAAIVNLYSPGDTLSLHRDVSEECRRPLASISLGCDGLFVVGLDNDERSDTERVVTIRLRSGDAVVMSGEARTAWHSVPQIIAGTCPSWMADWPATAMAEQATAGPEPGQYEQWRGWMAGKRINLNVRQMWDQRS